ncbi:MAG: hypothetical protein ABIN97_04780 [Ginsengibacter sp.]
MKTNDLLTILSKKLLIIILAIIFLILAGVYLWENNKFDFVKNKLAYEVTRKTDSLYTIKYDSLFFNELTGEAFLKNIRIIPDTFRVKNRSAAEMPYLLLDVTIKSITVKGVKTDKALKGAEIIGDSVIINEPKIIVYFLKPIKKETKIDKEANAIYKQILGSLDLIKVGQVSIRNAEVHAINFINHYRQFDINKTTIDLHDVRIDSLHNEDSSRILFCKDASFNIDQFTSYNDNKTELNINDIKFSGKERKLSFFKLLLNRFDVTSPEGIKLVEANDFFISGINTFEIVKNKNIFIDSIQCEHILFYRPPSISGSPKPVVSKRLTPKDTAGFRRAYSLDLKNIYFPDISVIEITPPQSKNNFILGKFILKVRGIKADEILDMQLHPVNNTKEVDLFCHNISYNSADNLYHYNLQNIRINSLTKQINIANFKSIPSLSEPAFAKQAKVQKDRYEISLSDISLNKINIDRLLEKELVCDNLTVNNSSIKIYRDISYPLARANKVGNYPSQVLMKSDIPINIQHTSFNNTYLEYKEKNPTSGKAGTINFDEGKVTINNMSNMPEAIKLNNVMTVNYQTKVLGSLPLNTTFKFILNANDGKFTASGSLGRCDAKVLNQISMPMAMVKIDTGTIDDADFNFTGNDYGARGEFVMKYKDFKITMFKKGEENKLPKKRGFLSVLANTFIKNENPHDGKLRSFTVEYDRDPSKSFFNLVWKSVFTGMRGTLGMPTGKIK